MERGAVVGGVLVSASFLLAVLLNRSAIEESSQGDARQAQPLRLPGSAADDAPGVDEPCSAGPEVAGSEDTRAESDSDSALLLDERSACTG